MTEEFSDIPLFMEQMAESIRKTTSGLDKAQTSAFFQRMLAAKRVYVAGAGRPALLPGHLPCGCCTWALTCTLSGRRSRLRCSRVIPS